MLYYLLKCCFFNLKSKNLKAKNMGHFYGLESLFFRFHVQKNSFVLILG